MKKLLLFTLFTCGSVSTVLPVPYTNLGDEGMVASFKKLSDDQRVALGGFVGTGAGAYIGNRSYQFLANALLPSLKKEFQDYPEYLKKLAKLEMSEAANGSPRKFAMIFIGSVVFCHHGKSLAEYINKKLA